MGPIINYFQDKSIHSIFERTLKTINLFRKFDDQDLNNLDQIPIDDVKAIDLLLRCETSAVFDLETYGIREVIKHLQPNNFHELKSELESYGHVFRNKSDTVVIVHGYKQWGKDVFNHLNGMFGIAIWDERKKKLILARDRMGI